jgi:flagellar assembly protein FliH
MERRLNAIVETYGYALESPSPGLCDEWLYAEVDRHGNPIRPAPAPPQAPAAREADWQSTLEERARQSYQAGLEHGVQEGRAAEREAQQSAHAAELERLASGLAQLTGEFSAESSRYFERVEQEAARLSLAIAARLLRREAQVDPLLLLGAVRVALGQLSASTAVRLRVPSADAELWKGAVALLPNRDVKLQIVADDDLCLGDCLIETELGSADLGVRGQLGEIEREFFNRAPASVPSERATLEHP